MPTTHMTQDGVQVTKGMLLHVSGGAWHDHVEKVAEVTADGKVLSGYVGTVFPGGVMDLSRCWSSFDAMKGGA